MEKPTKTKIEILEWFKAIIVAVIIVSGFQFFLVSPVIVDGQSMMPTLDNGDKLLVNKVDYDFNNPERFDIVVFHATKDNDFIKRVIGLPGEHIAYRNDNLLVNGKVVPEDYLDVPKDWFQNENRFFTQDFTLAEITGEFIIPNGYVFVLGDNRNASTDSRVLGLIPMAEIVGTTDLIFWPMSDIGTVKK